MNRHIQPDPDRSSLQPRELPWPPTTQAAKGMKRRPWSRAEIEAMVRAGIIEEDERFELIGGEVVPMPPKGARHEMVKIGLNHHLQRTGPDHLRIAQETTLWLDDRTFVEPDSASSRRRSISTPSAATTCCSRSRSPTPAWTTI